MPSLSTKNDLVGKLSFPESKVVVTAEGSEEKFKASSAEEVSRVKKKYELPDKYLIFVSRWERYKGLPVLLEAFESISKEFSDLGLVICGRPDKQNPEVADLVKAAQGKNAKIVTPGFVDDDDLPAMYSGAAVYVHPSWYEGFGIMILEAFGAGAPVVTSNVSSLPEVVGDAGLLVDPNSSEDVAAKIRQILKDPKLADDLRRKGFERVKQYSWAKMAEETLTIYEKALHKAS